MTLSKQIIDIPLGGLNTNVDAKLLAPGSLAQAQNVAFDRIGGLNKRPGYTELTKTVSGTTDVTACQFIFSRKNELLLSDGSLLLSYSQAASSWFSRGTWRTCRHTILDTFADSTTQTLSWYDCVTDGVAAVYVWLTNSGYLYYATMDVVTGSLIVPPTNVQSRVGSPSLVISGSTVYLVHVDTVSGDMVFRYMTTAAPTAWTGVPISPSAFGFVYLVAAADFDGAGTAVAVFRIAANVLEIIKFNTSGQLGSKTTSASYGFNPANVSVVVNSTGTIRVGVYRSSNKYIYDWALDSALVKLYDPKDTGVRDCAAQPVGQPTATGAVVWYYTADALTYRGAYRWVTVDAGGACAVGTYIDAPVGYICSRVVIASSPRGSVEPYLLWAHTSIYQPTYFLIRASDGLPIARLLPSEALAAPLACFGSVSALSGNRFAIPVIACRDNSISFTGVVDKAPCLGLLDFASKPGIAQAGDSVFVTGSILWEYNGAGIVENNFLSYPEINSLTAGASGGYLSDGTYAVVVVWSWYDCNGRRQVSAPSYPQTIALGGGGGLQKITCNLSCPTMTWKTGIRAQAYCTPAGGSTYYIVGETDVGRALGTVDITIQTVDTSREQLYTMDGTLEYTAPDQLISISRKNKRLFGVTDKGRVWYSHEAIDGWGVAFSWYLTTDFLPDSSRSYSLVTVDDNLVCGSPTMLQSMTGDGPAVDGTQNTLSPPFLIAADVGPTANTMMLKTHLGAVYRTGRGLYLLDRGLQIHPDWGSRVNACAALTSSAMAVLSLNTIMMFGHSDGNAYAYDYNVDQWSEVTGWTMVSSTVIGDVYYYATAAGAVRYRNAAYLDGASAIGIVVETPWIKTGTSQGFERPYYVVVLGEWRSSHVLSLSVYYDYSTTAAETVTFTLTSGYSAGDVLQLGHFLGKSCEAVKVRLADSSTTGESLRLSAISLEVAAKAGVFKLGTAQKA